jgi:predicted SAM-dependent methyltransferase
MSVLSQSRKLNLGCGEFQKAGFINVDYYSLSKPDVSHDLNQFPYPFEENRFELVEADHILEHLVEPFQVMRDSAEFVQTGRSSMFVYHTSHAVSPTRITNVVLT